MDNRIHHVAMGAVAAANVDIGLGICPALAGGEPLQRVPAIAVLEQWAGVASPGALGQYVNRSVEPHRDRSSLEQRSGLRIDEHAAPGRNDSNLAVDQPSDQPPLAVAIVGFAKALEQLAPGKADSLLDFGVAVDERQAEAPGEPPSDRRFSYTH